MNDQNQNAVYVQPQQSALGPQGQTSAIESTSLNSQNESLGTQAILFGDNTGAGSLLNQSQVLASSPPSIATKTNEAYRPDQKHAFPFGPVLIGLIVLLFITAYLQLRSED